MEIVHKYLIFFSEKQVVQRLKFTPSFHVNMGIQIIHSFSSNKSMSLCFTTYNVF